MALSRREAALRPARARCSRGLFGTVSVRSKLPPLYVLSSSPDSREASRDLWRSIGPSTMVVFKLRTSLWTHPVYPKIYDLIFMFKSNELIFPTFQTRRDSRDGCFWPAREEEDRRASHKRRQTSWNLARGGKVVRAGHRLGGGVGGWGGDRGGLTMRRAHRTRRAPA